MNRSFGRMRMESSLFSLGVLERYPGLGKKFFLRLIFLSQSFIFLNNFIKFILRCFLSHFLRIRKIDRSEFISVTTKKN